MPVPNIVAFRIDERLIHGQGQLWIKALGVNTVIVANDSASEDTMQQTLMTVSYTHLDVYKRQDLNCVPLLSIMPPHM